MSDAERRKKARVRASLFPEKRAEALRTDAEQKHASRVNDAIDAERDAEPDDESDAESDATRFLTLPQMDNAREPPTDPFLVPGTGFGTTSLIWARRPEPPYPFFIFGSFSLF